MTHVTCRLTAKNRDQLRNPTLGNRVWATFTFYFLDVLDDDFREGQVSRGGKLSYFRRRGSVHRSDVAYDQQAGRLGGAALKAITAGSPGHCRDTGRDTAGASWRDRDGQISPE